MRIAAASFDEMGGDVSAFRATALIKFLDPACLAMCGICAGKKKDVFLGDVIVASRVYRYDSGKFSASRRDAEGLRVEEFFHDFKTFNLKDTWRMDAAYFAREKDWTAELDQDAAALPGDAAAVVPSHPDSSPSSQALRLRTSTRTARSAAPRSPPSGTGSGSAACW